MHTMKQLFCKQLFSRRWLALAWTSLLLACAQVAPATSPGLPPDLVGIWADHSATLRNNRWLVSGQALYLAADGSGAIVAGPPPIGMRIQATFNAQQNVLSIQLIEKGQVIKTVQAPYHPGNKTIDIGSAAKPQPLAKRSDVMDARLKQGLGL